MIAQLGQYWNWQTAFLRAFHSHFNQLLDVEKWWSVSCVDFISRYNVNKWSAADCMKTLQRTLDVPVAVHFDSNQMPVEARITLQEVISHWPPQDANGALDRAVGGLRFLDARATPEIRPLVELYLKTLLDYAAASQKPGVERQLGMHSISAISGAKADAIKQLNALDRQREALWPGATSTNAAQFSATGRQTKPPALR
jgi:hypothetical protein